MADHVSLARLLSTLLRAVCRPLSPGCEFWCGRVYLLTRQAKPNSFSASSPCNTSCEGCFLTRRDKDWVMFVLVTVFCGTVVGAKQVGYVTDSCDTDWGRQLRQALMICSRLHSNTICFHACSLLITSGISRPCVLVFHEVRRNLTTFGFNELPEAVGNGIILGIIGGDGDIFDGRWCGRRHMLGEGSGGAVFWNVKVSYMHF